MTSLANRPNTALVVIDMQHGVVSEAFEVERVVANIRTLVDKARSEDVPVIWIQHSDDEMPKGSDAWRYIPQLQPTPDEKVVHKSYNDSFEATDLGSILAEQRIGKLIVAGAQTDACVRATLHGALARGYDTILVEDAHTTEDLRQWGSPLTPEQAIAYTNMYWSWASAEHCRGGTAATKDIDFAST